MCCLVGVRCVLDSQWNITEFLGKSGGEIYRRIRLTIFSGGWLYQTCKGMLLVLWTLQDQRVLNAGYRLQKSLGAPEMCF